MWAVTGLALALGALLAAAAFQKRLRQWRYFATLPRALRREWRALRTSGGDGLRDVACVDCPKFSRWPVPRCTVPFGSPVRKCITASVEYHLRDTGESLVLEIGCGSSSHAKQVVEAGGGRWIGIDPYPARPGRTSVRTVGGVVQQLPFRDGCFDVVCGVQTLEHWEDLTYPFSGGGYRPVLDEVWRVLKPGGWIYLDAPIHVHGAPEFIRGDLTAIRRIFEYRDWQNVEMLAWRRLHAPLKPRRPPAADRALWPRYMPDSSPAERDALAQRSAWIIAIRATKPASAV